MWQLTFSVPDDVGVATDGSIVRTARETQIAHLLDRLSDGEWHQVREDLCVLPNGGRITQPTARLSEMRGVAIERRKSPRYDRDGKYLHTGSDWRLAR